MAKICHFLVNHVTFLHFVNAISSRNINYGTQKKKKKILKNKDIQNASLA